MSVGAFEQDVQDQLIYARTSRRNHGDLPYPLEYTQSMVDFDVWDHMFFVKSMSSLTVHKFDRPPQTVLDLGCGGGFWALEAANRWKDSTITGFDIAEIQPNLQGLRSELARRVNWVHGNLLEGLPFPDAQFDFVRLAYLGLGIPEDEWQCVFEEISRVLKPGGVLEVIEEDLLFPCTTVPEGLPISPQFNLDLSLKFHASPTHSASISTHDLTSIHSEKRTSPLKTKLLELAGLKTKRTSPFSPPISPTVSISGPFAFQHLPPAKHPQDHTRIKSSWEAMLSRRFLAPKLLSVLPFYLSAYFDDVKFNAPYRVPLPPNSNYTIPTLRLRHSDESLHPTSQGHLGASPPTDRRKSGFIRSSTLDGSMRGFCPFSLALANQWTTMHLARTVNTIAACKEPIFREFERLYFDEHHYQYGHSNVSIRQVFDRDWNSWLNDMRDRMGMRDRLGSNLSWPETPGETSEARKWRSSFEPQGDSPTEKPPMIYYEPHDLCRSMRSFVARKY